MDTLFQKIAITFILLGAVWFWNKLCLILLVKACSGYLNRQFGENSFSRNEANILAGLRIFYWVGATFLVFILWFAL